MKTHHTLGNFLIRSAMAVLLGIGLALLLNTKSIAGDVHLDEIRTRTDLYKNVTVTGHNDTDIYIVHSRGMANVKIKDLDPETLWRVGLGEKPVAPDSPEATAAAEANKKQMPEALAKMLQSASLPLAAGQEEGAQGPRMDVQALLPALLNPPPEQVRQLLPVLVGILAVFLAVYLFCCYCLKLIVQKTGRKPGLLVWLPILQLIPLLRAAGMSMVWFLFWISPLFVAAAIPLVLVGGVTPQVSKGMEILSLAGGVTSLLQLVTFIVWCVKIVQARGKSVWLAVFLLLPVTNLFAFLYLAFSSTENDNDYESDESKIVIQSVFSEA